MKVPLLCRKVSSKSPLMYSYYETQYLGAAHGLTGAHSEPGCAQDCHLITIITMLPGVLLMLLSVPGYLEHNSAAERDIKTAVNFVVAGQTYDGNFPASVGEVSHQLVFAFTIFVEEYDCSEEGAAAVR